MKQNLTQKSDHELVAAANDGDAQAMGELYNRKHLPDGDESLGKTFFDFFVILMNLLMACQ